MDIPRIAELPATLASQIAAGEVIERPAAVVKELLDNSIDAGAAKVEVEIVQGGHKLIRVSDDGHGIHPDDIELALRRHSTSKLNTQADLDCITSLGFRGEALASIAAVSRFQLVSRMAGAPTAWCLSFDPVGEHASLKPTAQPDGTRVTAADLFQATPARRKFLRSPTTEFVHIAEVVKRVACSRFGIAFTLTHNGKIALRYRACADAMEERVGDILGAPFARQALKLDNTAQGMRLWGWLGGSAQTRSQSDRQFFLVNGRVIRDKKLFHAVRSAYQDTLPTGRYPVYLLHLEIDPSCTDVNVHPTKSEIKFIDNRAVYDFVLISLKNALGGASALLPATGDAPAQSAPARPARPQPGLGATMQQVRETLPFYQMSAPRQEQDDLLTDKAGLGAPLATLAGRLLLTRRGEDCVLVNFRKAWRYARRHQLRRDYHGKGIRHRPLLVPVDISVNASTLDLVEKHSALLERFGLSLRLSAADAITVKTIPTLLEQADIKALTAAVLDLLARLPEPAQHVDELLQAMTNSVETMAEATTPAGMQALLDDLDRTDLDTTQARHKGLWRTLSSAELDKLIDG